MAPLRIVFMGTPDLASASLQALLRASELQVVAVVTQPDQPKGRGMKLQHSPVKRLAIEHGLPVLQPARARDETFIEALQDIQSELIAVAAYGQILPQKILDLPRLGCLNVHTSLLPKYRGAAPIQRAILNGEVESGVTIMKMDAGLDTGAILTQEKTAIHPEDTSQTLHDRLAEIGAGLLVKTIPDYAGGKITPQPQPSEGVSYAAKIQKREGEINWSESSGAIKDRVRAMVPWPGAFSYFGGPSGACLLKIWKAELTETSGAAGEVLVCRQTRNRGRLWQRRVANYGIADGGRSPDERLGVFSGSLNSYWSYAWKIEQVRCSNNAIDRSLFQNCSSGRESALLFWKMERTDVRCCGVLKEPHSF